MAVLVPLLVILGLIAANAAFVIAEFSLVSAPRAAIKRRARQGEARAALVEHILEHPRQRDRYLIMSLLGVAAASLGLGMYGEVVVAAWLGSALRALGWAGAGVVGSALAVVVLTYLHIVLGEMTPKVLALRQGEQAALWVLPAARVAQWVLLPLIVALNGIGNGVLRLFGIRRLTQDYSYTADELRYIVEESSETGSLREEAGEIMLELFDFGELTVASVMVPRVAVQGIERSASHQEIIDLILAQRHTRYPVYEEDLDHIVGHVHVKHLFDRLLHGRPLSPVDYALPTPFVPATTTLDEVLARMRQQRVQLVVVMDEFGGTAGIATIEDLFSEVVGVPAAVTEAPEIEPLPEGRYRVAGTVRLEQLAETLGAPLTEEGVTTVSGLVLDLLGRPARVGDEVTFRGYQFTVTEVVEDRGVAQCLVQPAAEA